MTRIKSWLWSAALYLLRYGVPIAIVLLLIIATVGSFRAAWRVDRAERKLEELTRPGRDDAIDAAVRVAAEAGYNASFRRADFRQGAWFVDLVAGGTCLQVSYAEGSASAAPAIVDCPALVTGTARGEPLDLNDARSVAAVGFLEAWSTRAGRVDRFTTATYTPHAAPSNITKFTLADITDGGRIDDLAEVIVAAQVTQGNVARDVVWAVRLQLVDGKWFVDHIKAVIPQVSAAPATTVPVTTTTTR